MSGFVHLHVHSSYSLLEGAMDVGKLAKLALADGMPALALTDTNNLFGALEFSEKISGSGIQPIVGIELTIDFRDVAPNRSRPGSGREARGEIVLLAATAQGYENLMALSSQAFLSSDPSQGIHLPIDALEGRCDGVICLSGGLEGPIDRALAQGLEDLAEQRFKCLAALFGDRFYIEIQRLAGASAHEDALVTLADGQA